MDCEADASQAALDLHLGKPELGFGLVHHLSWPRDDLEASDGLVVCGVSAMKNLDMAACLDAYACDLHLSGIVLRPPLAVTFRNDEY